MIPPGFLNKEQRRIFRSIVKELEPSGILGNLDVYILTQCAVAIDRLQTMEQMINEDPGAADQQQLHGQQGQVFQRFVPMLQ